MEDRDLENEIESQCSENELESISQFKGDVIFDWFTKTSENLWGLINPVKDFFFKLIRSDVLKNTYAIIAIPLLIIIFVSSILVVGAFYLIIAPIIQILLVIICIFAVLIRQMLQWLRIL